MKRCLILWVVLFFGSHLVGQTQPDFEQYFIDKTMRIDYHHIGDATNEKISLDKIYEQGVWAGSVHHLIDTYNQGRYYIKIYDAQSNRLIYSRGFDSIFGEYKTTNAAALKISRTYHESALIPYPKNEIIFIIESRGVQNELMEIFRQKIQPDDVNIIRESPDEDIRIYEQHISGDPHEKADVVFVAEGYTVKEEKKVKRDLKKFSEILFKYEPYKTHVNDFNMYGVFKPSDESGVDEPTHGSFKNTTVNASFNSLNSPRYLLTEDNKALRDVAGAVPYDAIFVMVNHNRYGGGGIYNLYCTFTTDNQWYEYLFMHEFGHSFAGLADEYYTSSTSYNDFYPRGIEPTEPNITALLNPNELKWEELATPGIEIPTPWNKAEFDSMDMAYQDIRQKLNDKISRLKRQGADASKIQQLEEKSETLSREHAEKADEFLQTSPYAGKVGAFEGAGYSSEGLYRPMLDCIMFTKGAKPFCEVCQKGIERVIGFYTE